MTGQRQAKAKTPGAGRNGNVPPAEHRWKKGQSGNPKGPMSFAEFKHRAREHAGPALEWLAKRNTERSKMFIVDHGYGKAAQPLEHTGQDGEDIQVRIKTRKELVEKLERLVTTDAPGERRE